MTRDRLFLLESAFPDPAFPGRMFYCKDCITVEGLLAAFPEKARDLDVIRVAFPRPRPVVVEAIGEANQELPSLVLAPDAPPELASGEHEGVRFVNGIKALLHALHARHGFPEAHP